MLWLFLKKTKVAKRFYPITPDSLGTYPLKGKKDGTKASKQASCLFSLKFVSKLASRIRLRVWKPEGAHFKSARRPAPGRQTYLLACLLEECFVATVRI
mmetsp:Transcript_6079/g.12364  ORF Transcript_6079/g.12364 Transcript_6079/m.12364 type:complete len:99 (+) Transcript_6079:151-447(+)